MNIKSLKIKEGLFVNNMNLQKDCNTINLNNNATEPINQFLVFDRSGSMYGYLDKIIIIAKNYVSNLPEGSTISVGYFSGNDEYALTFPYVLKKELGGCIETIESYNTTLGLTNFIQILEKTNSIAKNLTSKSSLFFFTDGCHNTGGSKEKIEKALKEWSQYAGITMFVGYGWIDREMMNWMATVSEGSFIHLNKFEDFEKSLEDFKLSVEDLSPSIAIPFNFKNTYPISISGKSIIEYNIVDNSINFKISKRGYKGVYFITSEIPNSSELIEDVDTNMERGIRALSLIYSQKNNVEISLELLSYIGDKYLIKNLYEAITPDEFAKAETLIRKSIYSTKERYLEGIVKNYLPSPDAFCVLDVINNLIDDDGVLLYTQDPDFSYSKISKKTINIDGPKIQWDNKGVHCNKIVMNKERLNLSILTQSSGTVDLTSNKFKSNPSGIDFLMKNNIPTQYPVISFKTYSIIVDGKLHVDKLVLSGLSKNNINILGPYINKRKDGLYILDLSNLPLINKTYIKNTSAKVLAYNIWEEKLLKDQISTYKYLQKIHTEVKEQSEYFKSFHTDNEEIKQYLKEHYYIEDNKYQPPIIISTGNDQYEAYSFNVTMKGYSDVTASSVIKKIDENLQIENEKNGKKLKNITDRERIVEETCLKIFKDIEYYKQEYSNEEIASHDLMSKYFEDSLKVLNDEMKKVRKNIQMNKFAVILAKKGKFDEFENRENQSLELEVFTLNNISLNILFNFNIQKINIVI